MTISVNQSQDETQCLRVAFSPKADERSTRRQRLRLCRRGITLFRPSAEKAETRSSGRQRAAPRGKTSRTQNVAGRSAPPGAEGIVVVPWSLTLVLIGFQFFQPSSRTRAASPLRVMRRAHRCHSGISSGDRRPAFLPCLATHRSSPREPDRNAGCPGSPHVGTSHRFVANRSSSRQGVP